MGNLIICGHKKGHVPWLDHTVSLHAGVQQIGLRPHFNQLPALLQDLQSVCELLCLAVAQTLATEVFQVQARCRQQQATPSVFLTIQPCLIVRH